MKLIFVSPNIYPTKIGGAEIFNYYFIEALKKFHEITLISYCETDIKGINLVSLKRIKPQKLILNLQILYYLVTHPNSDYVILSFMRASWVNWIIYPLLRKIFSLKYIIYIHGGGFQDWKPFYPFNFFFKNASHIIAVSERACFEYSKRSNRIIKYLPPLIPFEKSQIPANIIREKFGIEKKALVLLYVGSIKKIKGTHTLIEAIQLFGEEYLVCNRILLIIAGEGELRKELEDSIKKSGLEFCVRFLGNVSREDIPDLYAISDMFLIPSLFENLSISMLEAMFNKKPIIAANSPGIREVLKNDLDALLFETENPQELKDKIEFLLSNNSIAMEIANKCFEKYSFNYNHSLMINQFNNILNEQLE